MTSQTATILAVDDVPDNLLLIESILEDVEGYCIEMANGGEEALTKVIANPPDIILLDVMMPDVDGYQVSKRIRRNSQLPYIPILLVTAHDQSSLIKGLDSGADEFIRKPFDSNELMARVRSLLRLKRSIDAQAEMIRQRDDVVSRLTHDLRTPLVAATRVLNQAKQGAFGDSVQGMTEVFDNIIENNEHLLNMTNTLLQVYRHEAGKKEMAQAELSLYSIAKDVAQSLKPLAEEKGLALEFSSIHSDSQAQRAYQTEGDAIELRRLLTNLLGNAIKFTDSGHIAVRLRTIEKAEAEDCLPTPTGRYLVVDIEDTGIGIAHQAQEKIFDWFYQASGHMRAGSGLGLHLSQRIAQMHGGTITLSSEPGKGSTFTLVLPQLTGQAPSPIPIPTLIRNRA